MLPLLASAVSIEMAFRLRTAKFTAESKLMVRTRRPQLKLERLDPSGPNAPFRYRYRRALILYRSRRIAQRNPIAPRTVARSSANRRHRRRTSRRRSASRSSVSFSTAYRINTQNGSFEFPTVC